MTWVLGRMPLEGPDAPGGAGCPWRGPLRALGGRVHPTRDHIGCRAETCMDKGCLPFALKTYRKTYGKTYGKNYSQKNIQKNVWENVWENVFKNV